MNACARCGAPQREGTVFCTNCGARFVEESAPVAASPVAASPVTVQPCARCGTPRKGTAPFCGQCGAPFEAPAPSAPPPVVAPVEAARGPAPTAIWDPLALVGLSIVTLNIYGLVWLYRVYKHMRAHSPGATQVRPARAVGFLFIPFFNFLWGAFIWTDMPRAVRRMQEEDGTSERLANRRASAFWLGGLAINVFLIRVNLAWGVVGELLILTGLVLVQRALNEHQAQHGLRVPSTSYAGIGVGLGTLTGIAVWFLAERVLLRVPRRAFVDDPFWGRVLLAVVVGVVVGWVTVAVARRRDPLVRILAASFALVACILGRLWFIVWIDWDVARGRLDWNDYSELLITWRVFIPVVIGGIAGAFAVRPPVESARKVSDAFARIGAGLL